MDIYFAMDVMNGKVVAGIGGKRDEYREISELSRVVGTSNLSGVVQEVRPENIYIADLDRIEGRGDNLEEISRVCGMVKRAIVDAGFRKWDELERFPFTPVLGTETFDITRLEDGDWVVSVDIKGELLDRSGRFSSFAEVVEYLNSFRLAGVLVLPIHSVGTMSFDFSIVELALEISDHDILTGGGMRSVEDLYRAKDLGVRGVLISTAVHRGNIGVEVLRRGRI
ncbi:HisA/HisF family protein [Geoglobus sp.]